MSYCEKTYGEILDWENMFNEIKNILLENNLEIDKYTFYDFGSGYGKIVNFFSKYLLKSIGIELVKSRYKESLIYNSNNISFKNINFFDQKINGQCIILLNNLCFNIGTNKRLSHKILNECKKNDIILTTLKLNLLQNYYLNYITLNCSWGKSELYIYLLQ
tara:strand:- start:1370 stop:1852 length:483 start_codon:yes stop_codon:yes gene_type:complete